MPKTVPALLLFLLLAACQPYMTYEELEADAILTGDSTRLDRFEATVQKADAYYENKAACLRDSSFGWVCRNYSGSRGEPKNIDEYVRQYRNERTSCGCVTRQQLREAMRGLGY